MADQLDAAPDSPTSASPPTSPTDSPSSPAPPAMSPRSMSSSAAPTVQNMTASSTPLGTLNAARGVRGPAPQRGGPTATNTDIAAKMKAFAISRSQPAIGRMQMPPANGGPPGGLPQSPAAQSPGPAAGGIPAGFKLPPQFNRPVPHMVNSSPAVPGAKPAGKGMSLAEKRGLKLPGGLPGATPPSTSPAPAAGGRMKPKMTLTQMNAGANGTNNEPSQEQNPQDKEKSASAMDKYADFIDTKTGSLKFKGKAVIHGKGIDFSSGSSFNISLDEVDTLDELGKGNYGTVYKVRHSRPQIRKPGQGLAGNKARDRGEEPPSPTMNSTPTSATSRGGTGIVMAMKEIRLELDDAKFAQIIMELDILHRCVSSRIVDFYGAFFQEGAVYICMEFMDGGSIDKLYGDGIPEGVLQKITFATVQGLKSLKDGHNIIHRDVKPTNILVNSRGQVKICDFGVSGNLVASIAKTNIGCQSYMAPERIYGGGVAQAGANPGGGTYSVQSDIWSLGLTIIECALGRYPYPPETYDNIFSQLSAIVDGEPPDLPADKFSEAARDFVAGCLHKIPKLRPTYAMLLQHAWLAPLQKPDTIQEEDEEAAEAEAEAEAKGETVEPAMVDAEVGNWVKEAIERRRLGKMAKSAKPALHAAPLDAAVGSPVAEVKPVAV